MQLYLEFEVWVWGLFGQFEYFLVIKMHSREFIATYTKKQQKKQQKTNTETLTNHISFHKILIKLTLLVPMHLTWVYTVYKYIT